jgi:hypothetical protein
MCMKCGCSTPNDKKVAAPMVIPNGGKSSGSSVIKPTDSKPGKYDYK